MAKHNYSQYSNNKKHKNTNVEHRATAPAAPVAPVAPIFTKAPEIEPMVETVKTVALPETVEGMVVNCAKLNVRANPCASAEVVCVLDAMSEIEIDLAKSTDEWFKVCTAIGVEGYCMRKFVDAYL